MIHIVVPSEKSSGQTSTVSRDVGVSFSLYRWPRRNLVHLRCKTISRIPFKVKCYKVGWSTPPSLETTKKSASAQNQRSSSNQTEFQPRHLEDFIRSGQLAPLSDVLPFILVSASSPLGNG
ncbi:hypothetical protein EVAR_692_1 [Eumeta japonica]|uniref:Uncharacterized protein n=1 Tax=Eumeta variegata TaxID=151549 RepID=A0A4C1SEJ2_EUMVA|nr:hypothetical protein EVAR_692_1 [Eumeta japonica]